MILSADEVKKDSRISTPQKELERAYGADLAHVIKRVFGYERRLLLFASIYFLLMLLLIGIVSGTNWINITVAVILGVGANVITTLLFLVVTNLRRS